MQLSDHSHPSHQGDFASTGRLQAQPDYWIELPQRDVFGQLVFALVMVMIGHLYALEIEVQRLAK